MRTAITRMIRRVNFKSHVIWLMVILFFAVITGTAIADKKWLYFGIVFIPLLIYLCIKKPFVFPFGLYVLLIPFEEVLSLTGKDQGPTLIKFLGILTILALSVKGALENKLVRPDFASIWWLLFVMYGFLSILWAYHQDAALSMFPTAMGLLLLYLVVASYQLQKSDFETIKFCILIGGLIASVFTIYNYKSGLLNPEISQRAALGLAGRSATVNKLSFDLLLSVAVCIGQLLKQRKIMMKGLFGIVLCVILFAVAVTGSRSAMFGVAVIFIVYVLYGRHRINLGAVSIVIGIIFLSLIPDYVISRWGDTVETGDSRLDIWYAGLFALKKYWLIGAGLSNFPYVYSEFALTASRFHGYYRGAHNIYLGFFVELGIVGITLMILAIWKHYKVIQSQFIRHDIDTVMLKAVFWAILVSSFFGDNVWVKSFWLLWMMICMYRNVLIHNSYSTH